METLHLNLKKKWFDMIKSGEKKEEYREITEYWAVRFIDFRHGMYSDNLDEFITDLKCPYKRHDDVDQLMRYFEAAFRTFDKIHFKNGFARNGKPARLLILSLAGSLSGKVELNGEPKIRSFILF